MKPQTFNPRLQHDAAPSSMLISDLCHLVDLLGSDGLPGVARELALDALNAATAAERRISSQAVEIKRLESLFPDGEGIEA